MDETDQISGIKLKTYIIVGTVGVAVIMIANFMYKLLGKGFELLKIAWF